MVLRWSPWLLPHNVLPNAQNAGSAGKRTWPWVHRPNSPQFKMAVRVASEHTYARNARARIRAMHVIGLLHTEVVWHTSQSPHTIWCSRHVRVGIGVRRRDWLCDGGWTLGIWANEISIFSYVEISAFTHVQKRGIRTHTNFTSESAAEIYLQMSSVWAL